MWNDSWLPIQGWCLYYGDGSTFSHLNGSWDEAPISGVQVLKYLHSEPYQTLTYGEDEYRLTAEHSVKFGEWMDDAAFYALIERVTRG